ncbi:hypothetical protein [Halocatena marina]|uniref:Uncharacterized protein n=1 Tax=Halocatena marina TaxID=2934937 RepID=A0ABD5YUU3_9EURY|nr:hypothetical protein [Halocatena marina]
MVQPAITDEQRRELGRYLGSHRDDPHRDPLKVALVLAGDRPAAFISPDPWMSLRSLLEFHNGSVKLFELFDLSSREVRDVPGWFVARNSWRLDLLPTVLNGCSGYHRRLGTVLGYPQAAIEQFIERESLEVPEEFAKRGQFDTETLAFAKFVFYLPEATVDGYRRAIQQGKDRYARLCTLAELWQLPDLKILADEIRTEFVTNVDSGEQVVGRTVV